jgi:hypothetical protein
MAVRMADLTAVVDGQEKPLRRPRAPHENGLRRSLLASEAGAKSELLPADHAGRSSSSLSSCLLTARFHLPTTWP